MPRKFTIESNNTNLESSINENHHDKNNEIHSVDDLYKIDLISEETNTDQLVSERSVDPKDNDNKELKKNGDREQVVSEESDLDDRELDDDNSQFADSSFNYDKIL